MRTRLENPRPATSSGHPETTRRSLGAPGDSIGPAHPGPCVTAGGVRLTQDHTGPGVGGRRAPPGGLSTEARCPWVRPPWLTGQPGLVGTGLAPSLLPTGSGSPEGHTQERGGGGPVLMALPVAVWGGCVKETLTVPRAEAPCSQPLGGTGDVRDGAAEQGAYSLCPPDWQWLAVVPWAVPRARACGQSVRQPRGTASVGVGSSAPHPEATEVPPRCLPTYQRPAQHSLRLRSFGRSS